MSMGDMRVVEVHSAGRGHLVQSIKVGPHRLEADEPAPLGEDAAGSPHEIALAGLGACTAMTLRLYAEMKKLPLRDVIVRLSYVTEDGTGPDGQPAKIDNVTREIEIVGDIDQAMRERMLQIAERCPVHRMMTGYAKFNSRLAAS
jgi:putative redox protein